MRVKELQKTVNVAWSPANETSIYLAAGTAAQQLDATFSAESVLEIYDINLSNSGYDMVLCGSQASPRRFHKVLWSPAGMDNATHSNGLIVGGCDGGHLQIYSAQKLLNGEESLIAHQEKHTGPVRSLDFNPFQSNLIASSASESEILIWDLNNTATPMTPGTKTQPLEDIQSVAWNRQVQHILASVFASRCVIWDLRKNEQIIKLSDAQSRVRWRSIQWHPEVATQLWLGSEEDQVPVVQLWDLRYSTAPAKTLQIHSRGILGLSYCPKDSEMIASCGKDFKILCWNPKSESPTGEILSEIASTNQWYADITWCPKNPALIAATSLDGVVSLYSLFGADKQEQHAQNNSKLLDSFPGMDQFAPQPPQQVQQQTEPTDNELKKPPKWLRKPIGASFSFGGKLISFSSATPKQISITQVTSEPQLVEQTEALDSVLLHNNLLDYCRERADQQTNQDDRLLWYFLKSNFEQNARGEILNLLGYDVNDTQAKYSKLIKQDAVEQIANHVNDVNLNADQNNDNLFDSIAAGYKETEQDEQKKLKSYSLKRTDDADSQITEAILTGNLEAAVELCLENDRKAEAIIIANSAGAELLKKTQTRYLSSSENYLSNVISALITNEWELVFKQCTIDSWREALVAALTHSTNEFPQLCEALGDRLLLQNSSGEKKHLKNAILCYICAGSVDKLVDAWKKQTDASDRLDIEQLHELVEIIMMLQRGAAAQGRSIDLSGRVANILDLYGRYLVSEGKLYSALTYLGDSTDERVADLREQIYYAIGHKSLPQQVKPVSTFTQGRNVRSNSSQFGGPPLQSGFNSTPIAQPWQPQSATYSGYTAPSPPAPQTMVPPVGPPSVADQFAHPPRPSSNSGAAPPTRNKYVLDPSVRSNQPQANAFYNQNPMYGGNSGGNAVPTMMQPQNTPMTAQSTPFFQPQPIAAVPPIPSNQTYFNPSQPPLGQPPQNNFTPFVPQTNAPGLPPAPVSSTTYDNNYLNSQSQSFPEPPPPLFGREKNPTPPPGWNDPPVNMKTRSRTTSINQDANQNIPAAPITHPIFGQEINHNIPHQQSYGGPGIPPTDYSASQVYGGAPPQNNYMTPAAGGYATHPNQFNQATFMPSMVNDNPPPQQPSWGMQQQQPSAQQHQQQAPVQRAEQALPVEKKPIPSEHLHIQKTFEDLRVKCIQASNNPQTKRKLEDVAKRLEFLYDILRESRITPNTLQSLNELINLITMGDYANSIALHTQMISGADFSQIASFMPGIKVLLQSANQMHVYVK